MRRCTATFLLFILIASIIMLSSMGAVSAKNVKKTFKNPTSDGEMKPTMGDFFKLYDGKKPPGGLLLKSKPNNLLQLLGYHVVSEVWIDQDDEAQNNEPTIAMNPTNPRNLVAAFHHYPEPATGRIAIALWYSMDGGATWNFSTFDYPAGPPADFYASDPALAVAPNGTFIFTYLSFNASDPNYLPSYVLAMRSDDGGVTWSGPYVVAGSDKHFYDKDFVAADPVRPGYFYVSFTNFTSTGEIKIVVVTSTDYGLTWGPPITLGTDGGGAWTVQGAYPAAGAGEVYVAWYNSTDDGWLTGAFEIWVSRSDDGGATFNPPVKAVHIEYELPYWLCPASSYHRLWGAMFPIPKVAPNGNLYIIFSANCSSVGPGDCADLLFIKSTDNGVTWSAPKRINDFKGMAQYYGWLDVDENGVIHVMWLDHRNSPPSDPNLYYDVYYSYSTDEGETWSPNMRVTSKSSMSDYTFIGDYNGLVASINDGIHPIWTDRRDKTSIYDYEDDVYTARLEPVRIIGGIIEAASDYANPYLSTLSLITVMIAAISAFVVFGRRFK